MNTTDKSSTNLNAQRRQAVQLRLAGKTLADVRAEVGLSTPTIVAAVKAFKSGGWTAVDVKPRGRPRLDESRESDVSQAREALTQLLSDNEENRLWTSLRVTQWLKQAHGIEVSQQTAATYLQNWQLLPPNHYRQVMESNSTGPKTWINGDFKDFKATAKKHGATVLWIGVRTLTDGSSQVYAHTLRGRVLWLQSKTQLKANDYKQFFSLLNKEFKKGVALVLPNKHLEAEAQKFQSKSNTTNLATLLCIVAPTITKTQTKTQTQTQTTNTQTKNAPSQLANLHGKQGTKGRIMTQAMPSTSGAPNDKQETQSNVDNKPTNSLANNTLGISESSLTHLQRLEAESIQIMREVVAEADNPVMLYSIGKDSAVMLHLARKAFYPASPPFPLLHVDTTWKFQEMYRFRDTVAVDMGFELLKHVNPEGIEKGVNPFTHGSALHTDIMKTQGLKQALDKHGFDVALGGARRDEEKSRAKERVFSFRTAQHRWEPKSQRPELWSLYNTRKHPGESIRVFPISNWTELDVWQYIHLQDIPLVPLYYAAERPVVERDGSLIMVDDDRMPLNEGEVPMMRKVRFRTLGCYPLTGAVESDAATTPEIIQEMLLTKTSERQGRMIDHDTAASMEKKKQEGYF